MIFLLLRFFDFTFRRTKEERNLSFIQPFSALPLRVLSTTRSFYSLICCLGLFLLTTSNSLSAQTITRARFQSMNDEKKTEWITQWINQSNEVELSTEAKEALRQTYQGHEHQEALVQKNGILLKVLENKNLALEERMCMARFLRENMDASWFPIKWVENYNRELEKQIK